MADETETRGAWGGPLHRLLQDMTDDAVHMLKAARPEPGDVVAIEKWLRAIGTAKRTLRTVEAEPAVATSEDDKPEDMMGERYDDGLEHEDTEVLRARLQSYYDEVRAVVEWKRNGRPEPGPDYHRKPELPTTTSAPAAAEDGLADLAAAGRAGVGQDLCGGGLDHRAGTGVGAGAGDRGALAA